MSKYQKLNYFRTEKLYSVYLGKNQDQEVLLKLLSSSFSMKKGFEQRFEAANSRLTGFSHPNLLKYIEFYKDNFQYTIVQEYFDGQRLAGKLKQEKLQAGEIKRLFLQLLSAVDFLHSKNVINGHIELNNLWLKDGNLVLDDYGLIEVLYGTFSHKEKGMVLTPPRFCSPEEIKGEPVGVASDIYSLGVILYALVEGVEPYFNIYSTSDLSRKIVEEPLPELSRFTFLQPIINKATDKDPHKRFASASEFASAIEGIEFTNESKPEKTVYLVAQEEQEDLQTQKEETIIKDEVIKESDLKKDVFSETTIIEHSYTEQTVVSNHKSTVSGEVFRTRRERSDLTNKNGKIGCLALVIIFVFLSLAALFFAVFLTALNDDNGYVIEHTDSSYGYRLFDLSNNTFAIVGLTDYRDSLLFAIVSSDSARIERTFSLYNSSLNDIIEDDTVFYSLNRMFDVDSNSYLPALNYIYTNGLYETYYGESSYSLEQITEYDGLLHIMTKNIEDSTYAIEVYDKMLNIKNIYIIDTVDGYFVPNEFLIWKDMYIVEMQSYDYSVLTAYSLDGKRLWSDTLVRSNSHLFYSKDKIKDIIATDSLLFVFALRNNELYLYSMDSKGICRESKLLDFYEDVPDITSVAYDGSQFYVVGNASEEHAFIYAYTNDFELSWYQEFGGLRAYKYNDVAIDRNTGNILVLGARQGFWEEKYQIYVVAFTPDGDPLKLTLRE